MLRGGKSLRWALCALAAALVVAIPAAPASAQGGCEYCLDDGGSGSQTDPSGDPSQDDPTTPTTPTVPDPTVPTVPTTETDPATGLPLVTGGNGGGKGPRPDVPAPDPVLAMSAVNATTGPQEIPQIRVPDEDDGAPMLALVLAGVAAICCALAIWRLRFLRELPSAPQPRTARGAISGS